MCHAEYIGEAGEVFLVRTIIRIESGNQYIARVNTLLFYQLSKLAAGKVDIAALTANFTFG